MDKQDLEFIKQAAQNGNMDFKSRAKFALKQAYRMNPTLFIKVCAGILFVVIVALIIIGIIVELENPENNVNNSGMVTIGKDYVVNTSISEADIIITDEELLKNAINSLGYSNEAKSNLTNNVSSFLAMQSQKNINAVFAIAVVIKESSAGTGWDLIDSSTYNWYSIKAGSSWTGETYTDRNGTVWRKYNSFAEPIFDFGELISTSKYYFGGENYTVSSISKSYCQPPEEWAKGVIDIMTNIFEACGIDTSKYDSISVTGNAVIDKSAKLFEKVYMGNYVYGATSIPPNNKVIDCSSFVDWVLYELGYTEFGGVQRTTDWWYNSLNPESYGWTWFYIEDNDISALQPGDIIVLNGTSYNKVTGENTYRHHMQIFVSAKDETHAYVYDCGGKSNWSVNTPTKGDSTFWGFKKAKVIRITTETSNTTNEE